MEPQKDVDAAPCASRCSTARTHRLTIYLDQGVGVASNITTDTDEPELVQKQMESALDAYYRCRWWMRPKTFLLIGGTPTVTVPIAKVLCFKVEPIRP